MVLDTWIFAFNFPTMQRALRICKYLLFGLIKTIFLLFRLFFIILSHPLTLLQFKHSMDSKIDVLIVWSRVRGLGLHTYTEDVDMVQYSKQRKKNYRHFWWHWFSNITFKIFVDDFATICWPDNQMRQVCINSLVLKHIAFTHLKNTIFSKIVSKSKN